MVTDAARPADSGPARHLPLMAVVLLAIAVVLWPPVTRMGGMALSESLFVLMVLASVLISVRLVRTRGGADWRMTAAAGGLAMGAAALTRYVGLALIAVGALALLLNLRGRTLRDRLVITAVWSTAAAVPSVLLLVRNVLVTGSLIGTAGRRTSAIWPITCCSPSRRSPRTASRCFGGWRSLPRPWGSTVG